MFQQARPTPPFHQTGRTSLFNKEENGRDFWGFSCLAILTTNHEAYEFFKSCPNSCLILMLL